MFKVPGMLSTAPLQLTSLNLNITAAFHSYYRSDWTLFQFKYTQYQYYNELWFTHLNLIEELQMGCQSKSKDQIYMVLRHSLLIRF